MEDRMENFSSMRLPTANRLWVIKHRSTCKGDCHTATVVVGKVSLKWIVELSSPIPQLLLLAERGADERQPLTNHATWRHRGSEVQEHGKLLLSASAWHLHHACSWHCTQPSSNSKDLRATAIHCNHYKIHHSNIRQVQISVQVYSNCD